ncbi:MAG: hypothetical protein IPJ48_17820 [Propionivibrio sp.]|uniref:Uncharacterized protein n=1 Tax=Candidatus Propionivibrio dominans TaxID=2954373 RepID=A0A9D7FGL4_9RHOO|nr:hypothetical protein [Candidatus Propionivibrio dominans]
MQLCLGGVENVQSVREHWFDLIDQAHWQWTKGCSLITFLAQGQLHEKKQVVELAVGDTLTQRSLKFRQFRFLRLDDPVLENLPEQMPRKRHCIGGLSDPSATSTTE